MSHKFKCNFVLVLSVFQINSFAQTQNCPQELQVANRRAFFRTAIAGAMAMGMAGCAASQQAVEAQTKREEEEAEKPQPVSHLRTAGESIAYLGAEIVGLKVVRAAELDLFNTDQRGQGNGEARPSRAPTWNEAVVVAPLVEEVLFRGLPPLFFGTTSWWLGVPVSIAFSNAHSKQGRIPAPQLIAGGVWWHFMRTRGLSHSMVAHAANNAVCMLLGAGRKKD